MKRLLSTLLVVLLVVCDFPVVRAADDEGVTYVVEPALDYDIVFDFREGLALVKKDRKCGFIDRTGREVVPPVYDDAWSFHEGFAAVKKGDKWGFIDRTGKEVVPLVYGGVEDFRGGFAVVGTGKSIREIFTERAREAFMRMKGEEPAGGTRQQEDRGKWGIVDVTGREVVPLVYDAILWAEEGVAMVKKDKKFGFIDTTGKVVVPLVYDTAKPFKEGLALVGKAGKLGLLDRSYGFVDRSGQEVLPLVYNYAESFSEGLAVVGKGDMVNQDVKCGFIDRMGNEVVPLKYAGARSFHEGYAAVAVLRKMIVDSDVPVDYYYRSWGFVTRTGQEWVPCIYDEVRDFHEGLAAVARRGKMGFVNGVGFEVVPPVYDYVEDFRNGLAKVRKGGKVGFVDKTGREVVPLVYDYAGDFNDDGLVLVGKDNKFGFVDRTGREVVPLAYDYVADFSEGLAMVIRNRKHGFVDRTGKEVVPLIYDDATDFNEGVAAVKRDGKWGIIASPLVGSGAKEPAGGAGVSAVPTGSRVLIDGREVAFEAYNINGYNYFKLRDLAKALSGSRKQIEVEWDALNNAVRITLGRRYTEVGGELSVSVDRQPKIAVPATAKVYVNGSQVGLAAYNIGGYNYFKLRDIAATLDFGVTWDAGANTIIIDTSSRYAAP